MAVKREKSRTKLRDMFGKKIVQRGMRLENKESMASKKLGEHLIAKGFNLMSEKARKDWYETCGNLKGNKVNIKRVGLREAGPTEGSLTGATGEIIMARKLKVSDIEHAINRAGFNSREEAVHAVQENFKEIIRNKELAKEALLDIEENLVQSESQKQFYFKKRHSLQKCLDYLDETAVTHEMGHLNERLKRGSIVFSKKNIPLILREELVVEYKTSLKHDGIHSKKLPPEHKAWFTEVLGKSYEEYKTYIASRSREYQKTKNLKKARAALEKKEVRKEMKENVRLLEQMHNQGKTFEEIRAKILRVKNSQ